MKKKTISKNDSLITGKSTCQHEITIATGKFANTSLDAKSEKISIITQIDQIPIVNDVSSVTRARWNNDSDRVGERRCRSEELAIPTILTPILADCRHSPHREPPDHRPLPGPSADAFRPHLRRRACQDGTHSAYMIRSIKRLLIWGNNLIENCL